MVGQSVLRLYRMEKGLPIVRSLMPEIPEVHFPKSYLSKKPFVDILPIHFMPVLVELSGLLPVL